METHRLVKTSRIQPKMKQVNLSEQIPYITLSFGMSLDGKIATVTGDSKYISGPESRVFVHQLRHQHDGILVGINTILIDHPTLTTRLPHPPSNDAHRIILDTNCRIDVEEPILKLSSQAKTIVVCKAGVNLPKQNELKQRGVQVVTIETTASTLPLELVLPRLYQMGIRSILVEGGSTIHFSFLKSGYVHQLYATLSPIIIGGERAKSAVGGAGFETLKESAKLDILSIKKYGLDYVIHATVKAQKE